MALVIGLLMRARCLPDDVVLRFIPKGTSLIFRNQIGGLENRVTFWHGEVTDSWWTEHVATYPGPIELFCCQLPDPRLKKNVKRGGGEKNDTHTSSLTGSRILTGLPPLKGDDGAPYLSSKASRVDFTYTVPCANNRACIADQSPVSMTSLHIPRTGVNSKKNYTTRTCAGRYSQLGKVRWHHLRLVRLH